MGDRIKSRYNVGKIELLMNELISLSDNRKGLIKDYYNKFINIFLECGLRRHRFYRRALYYHRRLNFGAKKKKEKRKF